MQNNKQIEIPNCVDCDCRRENSPLFCNLPKEDLDIISSGRSNHFYKKGQIIFIEGVRGNGLFCVHKGKVKLHKLGDEAKEQIIRFAKEGDVLGYRSLLSNEPYDATATAIEDCHICFMPKSKFLEVLDKNHSLAHKTIQLLTNDLRESEKKIIFLTQKPVIERISESLLILKEKFGVESDKKTLDVVLTRREIGNLAGVTTETTIRTLSQLSKKGILNLNGKKIELINVPRLVYMANISD